MSEVKTSDVPKKKTDVENYKNIKPESDMSVKETKEFWDNQFSENNNSIGKENPRQEKVDGENYYDDDNNGQLYREDNNLVPNSEYTINGYEYKTDDAGRIVSDEGKLHMKEHEGKLTIKDSLKDIGKGDELEETDHR